MRKMTQRMSGNVEKINFSSETMEARKQWDDIFEVLKK